MKHRRTEPFSAPPFAVLHYPEDPRVVTLPLAGYRQARNYACGFAATLMVLRHLRSTVPGRQIFEALGTARDGTGQSAIVRVLRAQGVRANVRYDVDFDRLRAAIDAGKPLVVYLGDEEHWLVAYGYGVEPRRVFVADPEPGKLCEHEWERYGPRLGGFGIVCSKRPKAARAHSRAPERAEPCRNEASPRSLRPREQLRFAFDLGPRGES